MPEKTVKCPKCNKIVTVTGKPGEVVKIICPSCKTLGKVTFPAQLSSNDIAIEVNNLRKEYGDLVAVDNISFKVRIGEVFAFLGPNGAGKTTTVEIIEAIRKPTSGIIRIFGKDISVSFDEIKEKIGVLPQEFHSFERLTVKETLVYFSSLYKNRVDIDDLLIVMGLKHVENMLYKNLSGGLRQRVGVAIALVNDPEIVFLDEPTTGLDPRSRRDVWRIIAGLREKGKTVFLTTHYMEEAEFLADHVAIIHRGRIIAEGSPSELITRYGQGDVLHIKKCKPENALEIIRAKGFNARLGEEGDIMIRIDHRERVLEVLSMLRHECIDYESIDIRRVNLEEIFLQLTGAKLSEE